MAIRTVRLKFAGADSEWCRTHDVPVDLLNGIHSPATTKLFKNTVTDIMYKHMSECQLKGGKTCVECDEPSVECHITPASWLHVSIDPFIYITRHTSVREGGLPASGPSPRGRSFSLG